MIKASALPPGYPIYSWVCENSGRNVHVDTRRLWQWVQANREYLSIYQLPVDRELAESFIKHNAVIPERVLQLTLEVAAGQRTLDPVILCKIKPWINSGPDALLVDGRHRYTIAHISRELSIPAYNLELHQWMPFRIVGYRKFTVNKLINAPLMHRDY